MKNPKVGDRVRYRTYEDNGTRFSDGVIESVSRDVCFVDFEGIARQNIHRTHLIRLKPKRKPMEIWINIRDDGSPYPLVHESRNAAIEAKPYANVTATKFREVRE